jgi:hypothetical protein
MTGQQLYELLPAIYRLRDDEQGQPLRAFVEVLAEQIQGLEESLAQSYDDLFIETCAEWAVPYIGDLIGYRTIHGVAPKIASRRAEVANTMAYRRRKGTAAVLEQLARDVTAWPTRVVEFFELLCTTQHLNHVRLHNEVTPDLRDPLSLNRIGTAFERTPHLIDIRPIKNDAGRYNIKNIGIFLFRIDAYSLTDSPAVPEGNDGRRFRFHPLGIDSPLFNRVEREETIEHLAEPPNVPLPIGRRELDVELHAEPPSLYGSGRSLVVTVDGSAIPHDGLKICDLSDDPDNPNAWIHMPSDHIAIDPVLGRIAFPGLGPSSVPEATFHYGFPAELGGGEYDRGDRPKRSQDEEANSGLSKAVSREDDDLAAALTDVNEAMTAALESDEPAEGVVEIADSSRYALPPTIAVGGQGRLVLRAGNKHRPTLLVKADEENPTTPAQVVVILGAQSELILDGLLITGGRLLVQSSDAPFARLTLRHCTLVPGLRLAPDGTPLEPEEASLIVEATGLTLSLERCIVGGIQTALDTIVQVTDSIVDATDPEGRALAGLETDQPDEDARAGMLYVENSTIIGRVQVTSIAIASNTIFLARADGEAPPIRVHRTQIGCVRFSYVPPLSQVPRRYRCQPDLAVDQALAEARRQNRFTFFHVRHRIRRNTEFRVRPRLVSRRYGDPAYCQLRLSTSPEIRTGADDESEMGVYHHLFQPQREHNLRVRLDEYLRVGMEAGLLFAS